MYNRPKPKETEEDIIKLQEQFLKQTATNSIKPAATVVKDSNIPHEVPSVDPHPPLADTFETIPSDINIGGIFENVFSVGNKPVSLRTYDKKGFPQAKRRDPTLVGTNCSIFSQQIKRVKKDSSVKISAPVFTIKENKSTTINMPQESYIIKGEERDLIHQENVAVLQKMTVDEIMNERESLLSTMDPAIVAYLKSRRKDAIGPSRTAAISEQNKAAEELKVEQIEATTAIFQQSDSERWLNFDTVELNKLAWMTSVDVPVSSKNKQYEARFDFDGWLLPFSHQTIDESNRTLYHHGDEPGRPGYTLQELFQLCRSSITQQQIIALNSISNILALYQSGIYDGIIEIPFEQIFFVLRVCLDDNTPSVLNAAIKATRNLFFHIIDETCLDNLLGFGLGMVQPLLAVTAGEVDDDNTINDQQLSETNLVKCLARSNILKRIRYIINTVQPSMETIVYCIEILMRLGRDSNYIVTQILQCDDLLESIARNFIPTSVTLNNLNSKYGCPLVQALKFFRLLAVRNKSLAELLIRRYNIMESVIVYISSESLCKNSNGLKLQIEAMHFWSVLIKYNLGLDHFSIMEPILLRILDFHVHNTNLYPSSYVLQGHVSALFNLITVAAQEKCNINSYIIIMNNFAVHKWKQQFCDLQEFSCGKLQIVSTLLRFTVHFESMENMEEGILNLLQSQGIDVVTKNIESCSNLLNNYDTHKMSANFRTVEAAVWNAVDHIVPVLQTNSCLPFLTCLSEFIVTTNSTKVKLAFLNHKNVRKYLNRLNKTTTFGLVTNWFTRVESSFIMNILKIAVMVQREIETSLFYEVAVQSLSVFSSEQISDIHYILVNVIFNRGFYPCETLIRDLDLNDQNNLLSLGLQNLGNICSVYTQVLNLKEEKQENLLGNMDNTTIIPVDWIYSPIILFYANQQSTKNTVLEDEQIFIITNCLRWIFIYETYFPTLANSIHPTDRFCRIACTFLCSDTLFLNQEIHLLLENCLKHILTTNEGEINFFRPIQGLNNFQDFYTLLLEQYQGVSYGDTLFGNFILLPLMQRHNNKYRKTLWSEYAGILQIFNVSAEQVLYSMNAFLYPIESDLSLLKCYRRALVSGSIRKGSFLYDIANHHVTEYLKSRHNKGVDT